MTEGISPQQENSANGEGQTSFNLMQTVKRRLYAMRNGALAAQMRRGGLEYRINFGLNIPQIKEIAADILQMGLSRNELLELAHALWKNENTRESRLTAPMIFPPEEMTEPLATEWLKQAQTTEIADHLCHSLMRKLPYAEALASSILADSTASDINRYTALRLVMNLLVSGRITPASARKMAEAEQQRKTRLTTALAASILCEVEFMEEEPSTDQNR